MAGLAEIRRRLSKLTEQLSAGTAPDPLAELRGQPDARKVWDVLGLARQRAVMRLIATVTLLPGRPGAPRRFDPASVEVRPA